MGLSFAGKLLWATGAGLELTVLLLALRRRLFERHPLFTIYLCLIVADEALIWLTYTVAGVQSRAAFYVYWMLQALLLSCRGATVYEICLVILAPFAGVWRLCRGFLVAILNVLALTAIFAASQSGPRISTIVSTAGRGLELAIVSILLLGLAFTRYYRVKIPGYLVWISLGFGFYSAVQVVNNSFLQRYLLGYFPVWNHVGLISFNIATVLWGVALWKPLPVLSLSTVTIVPGAYEVIAPHVTSRLRELSGRLLEMWK